MGRGGVNNERYLSNLLPSLSEQRCNINGGGMGTRNRPIGVSILSFLMVLSGMFYVLIGLLSFGIVLLLGIIITLTAIGLFEMKPWAWYAALVVYGISALINSFGAIDGNIMDIIGLIITIVIIMYLFGISGQFFESSQTPASISQTKDDALVSLFGKENIHSEYLDNKSKFKCPKCGSNDIDLMLDGSGICNDCKETFQEAVKNED
ncbi:MAG: hypothetical protein KAX31_00550 [Thermoplasmata archaeon]|nr:hypothetical protein [Thermoplasmata archaeon]